MLKLKQPRVGRSVEVFFKSRPDLMRRVAVKNHALKLFGDRTKEPSLDNLVCLNPELVVRVWDRSSAAVDSWSHDGLNRLRMRAGDKAIKTLSTKKGLKLSLPKDEVLLCELYGDAVYNI
ncbi:hypothetical protein Bca4012_032431 [Brassica carinata]